MYNAEKYIEECINSIKRQKYSNFEVIIVNDGSTDNSLEICRNIIDNDDRFIIISQKNAGVSNARNKALNYVTGQYIWFIDADDYIEDNSLIDLEKNLGNYDVIAFGYKYIYENCKQDMIFSFKEENIDNNKIFEYMMKNHIFIGALWNKVYKFERIKEIKFDTNFSIAEDLLYQYNILEYCENANVINKVLYNYRVSENNATNSSDAKKWLQFVEVSKHIFDTSSYDRKNSIIKYMNSNFEVISKLKKNTEEYNFCKKNINEYFKEYILSNDWFKRKLRFLFYYLKLKGVVKKSEKNRNSHNNRQQ